MNKKVAGIVAAAAVILIGGAYFLKGGNKVEAENNKVVVKEITHKYGTTKIEGIPKKVVVLDYGTLDALDALDVEVAGLPKSGKIPSYLDKFNDDSYGNTGSVKEPDLEAIHALEPDVIFMAGRMADYYDELSDIAPTVFIESDGANYMKTFSESMNVYGEIFDKKEKADELVKEVTVKAEEIKAKTENLNASAVMVNGRSLSAFGAKSRYGLLFNELGFKEADSNLGESTHGQEISFEYLIEKNPEYIFVVDRNAIVGSSEITAKDVVENELVKQTDAYKNGRIVYLNPITWYTVSGGYTSTLNMIEEVNKAI